MDEIRIKYYSKKLMKNIKMTISQKNNRSLDNKEEVSQYNVHDLPYIELIGHFKAKFIPDIYLFYKIVSASSFIVALTIGYSTKFILDRKYIFKITSQN